MKDIEDIYRQMINDLDGTIERLNRRLERQRKFESFMGAMGLVVLSFLIGLLIWAWLQ